MGEKTEIRKSRMIAKKNSCLCVYDVWNYYPISSSDDIYTDK